MKTLHRRIYVVDVKVFKMFTTKTMITERLKVGIYQIQSRM